jgi:hypothetical protein
MAFNPLAAIGSNLLLPDRYYLFETINPVARRLEATLVAVAGRAGD